MDTIAFVSRKDPDQEIFGDMLEGPTQASDIASYLPGDLVMITFYVSLEQLERATERNFATIHPDATLEPREDGQPPRYSVRIDFRVIKRVHIILPDWIYEGTGMRVASHDLILQPESDEAEEMLVWVQRGLRPAWACEKDN